jgi:hypothetical protein
MTTPIITLKEYFNQKKIFVIPNYQRGYKWAVPANNSKENSSAIEVLMDNLINANKDIQYFLQGVTVTEKDDKIILIDGQQRTTSLYLILWCLGREYIKDITLQYNIREESKEFISKLKDENFEYNSGNDKYQDIYYFKKAIEQVNNKLDQKKDLDRKKFYEFILNKVSILYIKIDEEKAIKTFTMMNGSKATMLEEELVKAEMLRMVSTDTDTETETENQKHLTSINEYLAELKEIIAKDWETNALRSKYAREWDKWLYWWNKEKVQAFFNVKSPMGLLLEYYYRRKQNKDANENFCFNNFKKLLGGKKDTKELFKGLRDLQKTFEDIYNTPSIHNSLGLTLIDINDKFEAINYFIDNKNDLPTLKDYAKWRLVGATHRQVTKSDELTEDEDTKESKANSVLNMLSQKVVYKVNNENNVSDEYKVHAYKQLLRFNMEEDDKLNRKFDFSIWEQKSLEHIHPKSKVYYIAEDKSIHRSLDDESLTKNDIDNTWINRDDFEEDYSEHCIGNLVLLYGKNNSTFGAKSFKEKKNIYFNLSQSEKFESRNLLHTISVFAEENWGIEEIKKNRDNLIEKFKKDYGIE